MENHSEYQFLIEQLQPSWLPNKRSQWHYEILDRLGAALFSSLVLVFGYLIVIIVYSTYSRYPSLYFHNLASDTVNFGILGILLGGLFGGFSPVIRFRQRSIWRLALNIIISAVGGGLVVGIVGRLISGRLGGGAVFGLAGAAAGTLAQGPALHLRRINVVETIRWSKERVLKLMPGFVVMGFIAGLLTGLLVNQLDGTLSSLFSPLVGAVVTGILMGVLLAVLFGLTHPELKARARPNEGIWRSARNAGWSGIEGAIIGVIFSLLTTAGPVTWLLLGLIGFLIGVLTNGGYACISHIALRYTLYRYDVLPWDCASFLDEAVQRVFLSRGGGRYVFIHRRLRRYFAELNHEGFPPLVNNRQSPKQQTTSFAMNLVVAAIFYH